MKYVKMLGLLAVAAAALMAFAGTAAATVVTAPAGTVYTSTISASTEGHAVLHNAFTTVECNGTVSGKVESHGAASTAGGKISTLSFTNCTNNTVSVSNNGSLEIHTQANGHGLLTSKEAEVVVTNHAFGGTCIYTTSSSGTSIGTLTPAPTSTGHATLDISATIPRTGGTLGAFCGSTGTWTGSYKVTSPTGLRIS